MLDLPVIFAFDPARLSWEASGNHGSYLWQVPASLPFFAGHFPRQPIMPASAILEACQCLAALVQPTTKFLKIKNAKFKNAVRPGESVEIGIKIVNAEETEWTMTWRRADNLGEQGLLAEIRFTASS
jgi:3-hydroxymyristoyl/3-hydroxydecanoyl-(acyl carrier protein) dehydratase